MLKDPRALEDRRVSGLAWSVRTCGEAEGKDQRTGLDSLVNDNVS